MVSWPVFRPWDDVLGMVANTCAMETVPWIVVESGDRATVEIACEPETVPLPVSFDVW